MKRNKKQTWKRLLLLGVFFLGFHSDVFAQDVDKEKEDALNQARAIMEDKIEKDLSSQETKGSIKDLSEIKGVNLPEKDGDTKERTLLEKDGDTRELAGTTSNLISNPGFESGHSDWIELYEAYDGNISLTDTIISQYSSSAYEGGWYADLNGSSLDWLVSSDFVVPVNTRQLDLSYWYKFFHSGSCSYGSNGIGIFLIDEEDVDNIELLWRYVPELDDSNYSYALESLYYIPTPFIGKKVSLHFITFKDDASCYSVNMHLDNVSLTATTSDACTGNQCKVYRFWSDKKQGHFYTMSEAEANSIIETYPRNVWKYEGVSWEAKNAQDSGTYPIYRFWSDEKQHHFYTISEAEKNHVIATYPESVWKYEGIAYYAYPAQESNTKPVYRFWSDQKQGHFYTSSAPEKDSIIANYPENVWKYEGIAWYVGE